MKNQIKNDVQEVRLEDSHTNMDKQTKSSNPSNQRTTTMLPKGKCNKMAAARGSPAIAPN